MPLRVSEMSLASPQMLAAGGCGTTLLLEVPAE
jgi:hypothetical protein